MAEIPANPRLWRMLTTQARARFHPYPSPAGTKWVHQHYLQSGGKFVSSRKDVDPKLKAEEKKLKAKEA